MIRHATTDDVPAMLDMGREFLRSSHYRGLIPENMDAMERTARMLVDQTSGESVVLLAVHQTGVDSIPVGMLGLLLTAHPISGESIAAELFWWVDPAFRGFTGIKLLRAAHEWAKSVNATRIHMVAPGAEVEKLLRKLKYDRMEVGYQFTL